MKDKTVPQRSSNHQKFKPVKYDINELQGKYDIYKNGSPNVYPQCLDSLKTNQIKNDFNVLELPAIDYVLKEIKNTGKEFGANKRDYRMHPSQTQKHASRFRDLVSDKQEITDFMKWFETKDQEIQCKNISVSKKFRLLQNLIGSGFHEIITQLSSISRPRSDILKILWNRQVAEAGNIIEIVHRESTESEKKNLQLIKSLHFDYQDQLIHLKTNNYCLEKKLEEACELNESFINTLRVMRKQIRKYQIVIKQLHDKNQILKNESINLLESNTKLMAREKGISPETARILAYRVMQIEAYRNSSRKGPKPKDYFRDIKLKAEHAVDEFNLPDIEERKKKLLTFIRKRIADYPEEKIFILEEEFEDEDNNLILMDAKLEKCLQGLEVSEELSLKSRSNFSEQFTEKGVNTEEPEDLIVPVISPKADQQVQTDEENLSTESISNHNNLQHLLEMDEEEYQVEALQQKITESNSRKRNSLFMIEINKDIEFKKIDSLVKMRRASKLDDLPSVSNTLMEMPIGPQPTHKDTQNEQSTLCETRECQHSDDEKALKIAKKPMLLNSIAQNHRQSFVGRRNIDLQKIMLTLQQDVQKQEQSESDDDDQSHQSTKAVPVKSSQSAADKINEFRLKIKKYLQNFRTNSLVDSNHEKYLKKILTNVFKATHASQKYDFLGELITVAKHSYGNLAYQCRLLQFIAMILQNKQEKSLLKAISLLLRVEGYASEYRFVNSEDVNEVYFRIYFNLSLKHPSENRFNIWKNYTNINKINHPSFSALLKEYFSDSKCTYLNMKIKEFVAIDSSEEVDGSQFIRLNPLMTYLLDVYLVEKSNYYESYHQFIDFLSDDNQLDLETFAFLLNLLCFDEEQQSVIVMNYFSVKNKDCCDRQILRCNKDCFYRVCVKYELPLFEFMRILKTEHFKSLSEQKQKRFGEFTKDMKWDTLKSEIVEKLYSRRNQIEISYFIRLITRLDLWIKENKVIQKETFAFLYRLIVQTAFIED